MKTIKKGDRGNEVAILQKKLGVTSDSIFGPKTEAALKEYQRTHGLSVDGICGAKTWTKLGCFTAETPQTRRFINEIIVHCSATKEGQEVSSDSINLAHKARKFSGYKDQMGRLRYIGYHYIIHLDGRIESCRPESVRGCHAVNHNGNSIGICYIGGLDARDKKGNMIKDTRTPQQKAALIKLIKELKVKYPTIKKCMGHRDTSPDKNHNGIIEPFEFIKGCPCFDAIPEYKHLV